MAYLLEVIAFDIESCAVIEQQGADRIELCANPEEGGTTPSYGMIKAARKKATIQLFPIIRPRGGNFFYNDDEFSIMKQDVQVCKELGCEGVVIGLLNQDGTIDTERTKRLVEIAYPMDVTFHRAFDRVKVPLEALEKLIDCGCTRILTSGLHPMAIEGKDVIMQLVVQANGRIIIMPGSGIRSSNIQWMAEESGAVEFHSSARKLVQDAAVYTPPTMNEQLQHATADREEIKAMVSALKGLSQRVL